MQADKESNSSKNMGVFISVLSRFERVQADKIRVMERKKYNPGAIRHYNDCKHPCIVVE